jgi:hypothetical protein
MEEALADGQKVEKQVLLILSSYRAVLFSGVARPSFWGDETNAEGVRSSRGDRVHAPPEKF